MLSAIKKSYKYQKLLSLFEPMLTFCYISMTGSNYRMVLPVVCNIIKKFQLDTELDVEEVFFVVEMFDFIKDVYLRAGETNKYFFALRNMMSLVVTKKLRLISNSMSNKLALEDEMKKHAMKKDLKCYNNGLIFFELFSKELHKYFFSVFTYFLEIYDNIPHEVCKGLYLGSIGCAMSGEGLKKYEIKTVISAINYLNTYEGIRYHFFNINDSKKEVITKHFKATNGIIKRSLDAKKNVLVHCFMGISRSATIIIAYLM